MTLEARRAVLPIATPVMRFHRWPSSRWGARVALALAAVAAVGPAARADESAKIVAEQLFTEAHGLLDRGDVAAACEKLHESERLDPAGGTALLLGICYEHQGKLASAWSTLRSARAMATRDRRQDRVDVADAHLRDLEPKLAHLTVSVALEARVAGLVVRLDGVVLDEASRGVAIPVDPGPHQIRAAAPARVEWVTSVVTPDTTQVTIAPLGTSTPPAAPPNDRPRAIALVATGAGSLVAAGVATYFGIGAMIAEERKPLSCLTRDAYCVNQARSLEGTRTTDATAATVAGVVAGGAAASFAALLLFPPSKSGQVGLTLSPFATAGASLRADF